MKEKVLVVGLGEVGRPLFEIIKESKQFEVYGLDLDKKKMSDIGRTTLPKEVDVMHICIPFASQSRFVTAVIDYAKKFKPKLLIINSTVTPFTTQKICLSCNCLIAHSPVYGTHKGIEFMKWEIRRWRKVVGGVNSESAEATQKHFEKLGIKTRIVKSPLESELAKIFETTYAGWMITYFQEIHRITRNYKAELDEIVACLEDVHRTRLDRPIWYPGVIGGHCLIQNLELLLNDYNSELLKQILKSNEKRKEEIKDKEVMGEVEKVKKRYKDSLKELWRKNE